MIEKAWISPHELFAAAGARDEKLMPGVSFFSQELRSSYLFGLYLLDGIYAQKTRMARSDDYQVRNLHGVHYHGRQSGRSCFLHAKFLLAVRFDRIL